MLSLIDVAIAVLLLVVATILEYVFVWRRLRADHARERRGARERAYRTIVIGEWVFALSVIAVWTTQQRSWAALGFGSLSGWRLAIASLIVLAGAALLVLQLWSVLRLPAARRIAVRPKLERVAFALPHTRREVIWFLVLSATAGVCEELLYRGYLVWLFAPWLGTIGAMSATAVAFGLSHSYQGRQGAITATIIGAIMAAIVLATGSLVPAMIVHAFIDIGSGTIGYWLLREPGVGIPSERSESRGLHPFAAPIRSADRAHDA